MEIKTQTGRYGGVEVQFSDAFEVADFNAVQRVVEVISKLRKDEETKPEAA